jgi:hypothetical protein
MKLLVHPDAGVTPIVAAIKQARTTIADLAVVKQMQTVFEQDGAQTEAGKAQAEALRREAQKDAKDLPDLRSASV